MRHHRTARTELTAPHAVIYLRVSTDDQARGISLSVQDRDCRAWCVTAGVSVAAVFVEPESAKTDARAEFQKAVAIAKAEQGAAVLQDSDVEAVMVSAEQILRDLPSASNRLDQADRHALYAILWPRGLTITRTGVRTAVTECQFVPLQTREETSSALAPQTVDASNLIALYRRLVEIAA